MYDVGGIPFTKAGYDSYIRGVLEGQREDIVDLLSRGCGGDQACRAQVDEAVGKDCALHGGNCNFSIDRTALPLDISSCVLSRCGGLDGSLHFNVENMLFPTSVHLDTANPLSFFGLGAIEHFLVDVFLGNTLLKDGIPR
jgi:hypothetical protein